MIGQYLSNTNESVTALILQKKKIGTKQGPSSRGHRTVPGVYQQRRATRVCCQKKKNDLRVLCQIARDRQSWARIIIVWKFPVGRPRLAACCKLGRATRTKLVKCSVRKEAPADERQSRPFVSRPALPRRPGQRETSYVSTPNPIMYGLRFVASAAKPPPGPASTSPKTRPPVGQT
jgi:hypothetical protein